MTDYSCRLFFFNILTVLIINGNSIFFYSQSYLFLHDLGEKLLIWGFTQYGNLIPFLLQASMKLSELILKPVISFVSYRINKTRDVCS